MKWFIKPDTKRLDIGDGEWIDVKARLTHGEREKMLRLLDTNPGGSVRSDLPTVLVNAYLVGWSLTDDGKPVKMEPPPDMSDDRRLATLRSLSTEAFDAIHTAVDAHFVAMKAEDDASKNGQSGESGSSATSPLPDSVTGDTKTS
jgi:hypothetical protein